MGRELNQKLLRIFEILGTNSKLSFYNFNRVEIVTAVNTTLLYIDETKIVTPVGNLESFFENRHSPLANDFVSDTNIRNLFVRLIDRDSVIRLNHMGVCYLVDSQIKEKTRLIELTNKTNLTLYEEESNDAGLWLFLGDLTKWDSPLLEFLPVEKANDEWLDYWLPHLQIDIDTNLDVQTIEAITKDCFGDAVKPFRVTLIDKVVYTVRLRLGVIDGVNIHLDIATNSRRVEFMRTTILKKIS